MMRYQKRWACAECHREWIYRTQGPEGNCPACGSHQITQVEFHGLFDIHTPADVSRSAASEGDIAQPSALRPSDILAPAMVLVRQTDFAPELD